jgi:hypothetical protein
MAFDLFEQSLEQHWHLQRVCGKYSTTIQRKPNTRIGFRKGFKTHLVARLLERPMVHMLKVFISSVFQLAHVILQRPFKHYFR